MKSYLLRTGIYLNKFSLIILSVVLLTACLQYDDGPFFSFFTRKARITNSWQLEEIENVYTGSSCDSNISMMVWTFKQDGDFWKSDNSTGEWEFLDQNTVKISYDTKTGIDSSETYDIMRLTMKQLWIIKEAPWDSLKYKYVPVK
ncbi:MAG: hypothetical protein HY738_05820 [Bacteroidia bacterium]|nr:hypothetical protein [Bacteroidia bacterium]